MKTRFFIITLIFLLGVFACVNARNNYDMVVIVNETTKDTMTCETYYGFCMLDSSYEYKVIDKDIKPEVETDPCTNCNH